MSWQRLVTLLCGMLLCGVLPATAAESTDWAWGGSFRSLNLGGTQAPGKSFPAYRLSSTRLRLETSWQGPSGWRAEVAADHQLLGSDPAGIVPLPDDGVNRRLDLDHNWQHDNGWASRLQVDRLNLTWSTGHLETTFGRQAVGFGRIVILSPLDVISPFPPDALDTDVRPGVDALRLKTHYGLDGQLDAVAVPGDVSRHDSYLVTWADNRAGIDLLAIVGRLRDRPMLGVGFAGNLGPLGLKGEAAGYQGTRVGKPDGDLHRHFAVAALESWYRFDNGITLITQYLYNGAGADNPAGYTTAALSAPIREGLTSLLGQHYLLAAPSYELHPLVTLNGLLICNLGDNSWLLRPTLAINLADNLGLELFWIHPEGTAPRQQPVPLPPAPRSEFGQQGESGGFFIKWFF